MCPTTGKAHSAPDEQLRPSAGKSSLVDLASRRVTGVPPTCALPQLYYGYARTRSRKHARLHDACAYPCSPPSPRILLSFLLPLTPHSIVRTHVLRPLINPSSHHYYITAHSTHQHMHATLTANHTHGKPHTDPHADPRPNSLSHAPLPQLPHRTHMEHFHPFLQADDHFNQTESHFQPDAPAHARDHSEPPASSEPPREPPAATPSPSDGSPLPNSVRGAPDALKPAIRKKQNKEVSSPPTHPHARTHSPRIVTTNTPSNHPQSARRSRQRRQQVISQLGVALDAVLTRLRAVETRLDALDRTLASHSRAVLTSPDPSCTQSSVLPAPPTRRPPHHSRLSASRAGASPDDPDIDRLVRRCLDQL